MRALLQRVNRAEVRVDGRAIAAIGPGLLVLLGVGQDDDEFVASAMAAKVAGLRIFADSEGLTNLSVGEVAGEALVVSQFTLYGDSRKGRRPSFVKAAHPDLAIPLYEHFVEFLRGKAPGKVETGEFGAMMDVALVNEGPVTLVLER